MTAQNLTNCSIVRPNSFVVSRPLDLDNDGVFKWEDQGKFISKIAVYIDPGNKVVNYIEVFGGQGNSLGKKGTASGEYHEISFNIGDAITDAKLFYTDWGGGRINGMSFTIQNSSGSSSSQSFGNNDGTNQHYSFPQPVILKGVYGWAGLQVDILALAYSQPVKKYEWTNVNFDLSQLDSVDNFKNYQEYITVAKVDAALPATGYKSEALAIKASTGFTNSATFTSALTLQAGIESTTTLNFPMVGGTQQIKLSGSAARTTGSSVTVQEVVTLSVEGSVTIDPGYQCEVEGVLIQANISVPYTASLKVTYSDDTYETFSDNGVANCVQGIKLLINAKPATPITGTTSPTANVLLFDDGAASSHVPVTAKTTMTAGFLNP
jgi:hypothetical protein